MSTTLLGRVNWGLSRDKEGYREYNIRWKIQSTTVADGPATVLATPGLPVIGSSWLFGNDADTWCRCWPTMTVTPQIRDDGGEPFWYVDQTFTNKPLYRCQTTTIESPLDEPAKLSGTFVKYIRETTIDRNGDEILSSSHEPIPIEKPDNRPTVNIEQNFLNLPLVTFCEFIDGLNDATLWGLPKRCVKLSNVRWTRKLYGVCTFYYTVAYNFEIDFRTFDREYTDMGTKTLERKFWDPNHEEYPVSPDDPDPTLPGKLYKENLKRFVQSKDDEGSPTKVTLDGSGRPAFKKEDIAKVQPEVLNEYNLLLLGIPAIL